MGRPTKNDLASFGFTDLHGFKDFVGYVISCAPELFPEEDWLTADQQMNLDRAFVGLRYGLDLTAKEVGASALLDTCRKLVERSYLEYKAGEDLAAQRTLEEMDRHLQQIPSQ